MVDSGVPAQSIFKAYDIRGIVGQTLTEPVVRQIGAALGLAAREKGVKAIVVGRDGRLSGPALIAALAEGINRAGLDAIDIGMVPTPVVYYATYELGTGSGVAVTGSHNPPEYNGLKMMVAGETLYGDAIRALYDSIVADGFEARLAGITPGTTRSADLGEAYLGRITGDVKLARPMKIAVDCGNGVAGALAPELYRRLGCEVIELFCEVDGNFPNHHPDPAHPENLQDLIRCLRETDAEIGLAFDGDGDRLGVVTKDGQIVYPDRQLMLFAQDVLTRVPGGQIIYDVKCSRNVARHVREHGGDPLMWRTGHSLVKAKLRETGAPLAGVQAVVEAVPALLEEDVAAHLAGARLLEILAREADPSRLLNALPNAPTTPELQLKTAEGENFALVERLRREAKFERATEVITIDGVRAEYPDGFGLARPSNTTPVVVLRFEADDDAALARIQDDFRRAILAVAPDAKLPF
ncbi:MAG: phosphomannomutase/phosphoglucomutase [Gemmatimonadales bacterium]|nr:phosphomannomutase/phosphoglucomutase [Gemmatimonadales bacterium]